MEGNGGAICTNTYVIQGYRLVKNKTNTTVSAK